MKIFKKLIYFKIVGPSMVFLLLHMTEPWWESTVRVGMRLGVVRVRFSHGRVKFWDTFSFPLYGRLVESWVWSLIVIRPDGTQEGEPIETAPGN